MRATGVIETLQAIAMPRSAVAMSSRWITATPTRSTRSVDDPLGPTDQNPDTARDTACDLTASEAICSPATIPDRPPPTPPDSLGGGGSAGSGLGVVLVVLLVAALIAAIVWVVVATIRQRGMSGEEDADDELDEEFDVTDEQRIIDVERPPDRWRRAAEDHRGAGRFRDAVRCQYRGLVGDLARAGIVDEIPGRTSGEERGQLAELAPDVSPAFDAAAEIFDAAWFNDDEVTAADDEHFRAAERAVLDHVFAAAGRRGTRGRQR